MTSTAISAQGTQIQIATGTGSAVAVTGVTVGNPTVIASTAHGFNNGDAITFDSNFSGADASHLNGKTATVIYKTTNTYAVAIDTTGLTITTGTAHATATSYTTVGNARTFTGLDGSATELDKTNLASSAKEIALGLVDFGQFTFEADHDNGDAGQAAVLSHYTAGTVVGMKVILPSGTTPTASFNAFIKKFSLTGGIDAIARRSIDCRITGTVTWA
jgi:hypothetical protein